MRIDDCEICGYSGDDERCYCNHAVRCDCFGEDCSKVAWCTCEDSVYEGCNTSCPCSCKEVQTELW